jgi:hypothetical protein
MASETDPRDRGFTVVDKRAGAGEGGEPAPPPAEPQAARGFPRIDFSTFCLSLGTSALYHLGAVGDPETGERTSSPNLALARHTIDTLEMLQEKTRGNLDEEEVRLLEGLLYELHMRYVEAGEAAGPGADASGE